MGGDMLVWVCMRWVGLNKTLNLHKKINKLDEWGRSNGVGMKKKTLICIDKDFVSN